MRKRNTSHGFTIVELLIVIIIIGILATITIVAYNGLTRKAHVASLVSDLKSSTTLVGMYNALNGQFPDKSSNVNDGNGLPAGVNYFRGPAGLSYCVDASRSIGGADITFYATDVQQTPIQGGCADNSVFPQFAKCTSYKDGDTGPAGGIILKATFYPGPPGVICIEVAPSGWSGFPNDPQTTFGCYGTKLPGTFSSNAGTGKTNTEYILSGCAQDGIAAKLAADYHGGGLDDWFLPSFAELGLLASNKNKYSLNFMSDLYISSSQLDSVSVWLEWFGPYNNQNGKNIPAYVRPIRIIY